MERSVERADAAACRDQRERRHEQRDARAQQRGLRPHRAPARRIPHYASRTTHPALRYRVGPFEDGSSP